RQRRVVRHALDVELAHQRLDLRVPVVVIAYDDDRDAGLPRLLHVRTGAHRLAGRGPVVGALRLNERLLEHHAWDGGHLAEEPEVRLLELDRNLRRTGRGDRVDAVEHRGIEAGDVGVDVALEAEDHVIGRHRVAVPELHTRLDREDERRRVRVRQRRDARADGAVRRLAQERLVQQRVGRVLGIVERVDRVERVHVAIDRPHNLVHRLGAGLRGDGELLVAGVRAARRPAAGRDEDDEHADECERRPPPMRLDHVTPPYDPSGSGNPEWAPLSAPPQRLSNSARRSRSEITRPTGSAGERWPSRPVISSFTKSAFRIASSVACTTASKSGSTWSHGSGVFSLATDAARKRSPEKCDTDVPVRPTPSGMRRASASHWWPVSGTSVSAIPMIELRLVPSPPAGRVGRGRFNFNSASAIGSSSGSSSPTGTPAIVSSRRAPKFACTSTPTTWSPTTRDDVPVPPLKW